MTFVPDHLTPAHYAVEMEDIAKLRELLDAGADVNDPNEIGMTLLMHAVDIEGDGAGEGTVPHADLTAFLLARGADPFATDQDGGTALSLARGYRHWVAVELIEAWQALLTAADRAPRTPPS